MTTATYLETSSQDPAFNLAFEEYVLNYRTEGDYLILWQNTPTVVIGQNQNAEAEINREFVEQHQINVVRRMTGGGAVYHDSGNLNYSFITDLHDTKMFSVDRFTQPIVKALCQLGLSAETSGRNDILVSGKKVSGTAQRIVGKRILHHGTLLFDSNPDAIAGALHVAPEKFRSKSAKSVRSRVGNIRAFLPEDMDLPAFWEYLKQTLCSSGSHEVALSQAELEQVQCLKEKKYDTWIWTYGRSPAYDVTSRKYWGGGLLEYQASVKDGKITEIRFYGDFLSLRSLAPLTDALRGCLFRSDAVKHVLAQFPLSEFFGSITLEEIINTMFYV